MQQMSSRIKEIELLPSKETESQVSKHIYLSANCATYIPPENELVEIFKSLSDGTHTEGNRPDWLLEIIDMMPSNVLEFPIQKPMSKLELVEVEYKFESVTTKKGEELNHLQGCLLLLVKWFVHTRKKAHTKTTNESR